MDALLADRAKQEADEASMSTRSHHQKVAGGNRTEKDLGGASLDDLALDLDAFDPPATSPIAFSSTSSATRCISTGSTPNEGLELKVLGSDAAFAHGGALLRSPRPTRRA